MANWRGAPNAGCFIEIRQSYSLQEAQPSLINNDL